MEGRHSLHCAVCQHQCSNQQYLEAQKEPFIKQIPLDAVALFYCNHNLMILRLLENVTAKKKQTTNNMMVLTLSGKLLLFHNKAASANNTAQLHFPCCTTTAEYSSPGMQLGSFLLNFTYITLQVSLWCSQTQTFC